MTGIGSVMNEPHRAGVSGCPGVRLSVSGVVFHSCFTVPENTAEATSYVYGDH